MKLFLGLKYDCRCPTCRAVGQFQPNPEIDAAVASLSVRCPYRASGTACRWTGRLEDFENHQHVFDDQQQQQQPAAEESRGRKRPRSDNVDVDDDEVDNNDDAQVPPPPKVSRPGGLSVSLFGYVLQIDRSGIHFHAGTDNSTNTPAPDPSTEATAPTTEHP